MTQPSVPDEIQALVAGYVLGDLDADERAQFQQLLADTPELAQDITTLTETLSLLPYGLTLQKPASDVRSRLMMKAQTRQAQEPIAVVPMPTTEPAPTTTPETRASNERSPSVFKVRLAAAIAVILGGCSLVLAHRVSTLQTRLAAANQVIEMAIAGQSNQANVSNSPALTIQPADALLTEQWSGIRQIIQDHVGSLERSQGPVDIAAGDPMELRDKLRTQRLSFDDPTAQVPTLPLPQAQLLGGSPCQFSETKGLRMTYTLPSHDPISLYQIDVQGSQFPTFSETYITVTHGNINVVLWRQDEHLYALAADLPQAHLQFLTQVIELI